MVKVRIREDLCKGCGMCEDVCPNKVMEKQPNFQPTKVVNEADCIECLSCLEICPAYAIEHEEMTPVSRLQISTTTLEMIRKIL